MREPGRFSTSAGHLSEKKISTVEHGAARLLSRAATIGDHTETWATEMIVRRGVQGLRTLQGLLALSDKHTVKDLEKACEIAHSYGAYRLSNIRRLIQKNAAKQEQLMAKADTKYRLINFEDRFYRIHCVIHRCRIPGPIAQEISKNTYVNVMDQYRPCGTAHEDGVINRRLTRDEFKRALGWAEAAGLTRLDNRERPRIMFGF